MFKQFWAAFIGKKAAFPYGRLSAEAGRSVGEEATAESPAPDVKEASSLPGSETVTGAVPTEYRGSWWHISNVLEAMPP